MTKENKWSLDQSHGDLTFKVRHISISCELELINPGRQEIEMDPDHTLAKRTSLR